MQNFYTLLNISPQATAEEIKKAYRKLAIQYHPDKHAGNAFYEEKFKEISKAYSTLADSKKREVYNQKLTYWLNRHTIQKKAASAHSQKNRYAKYVPRKPTTYQMFSKGNIKVRAGALMFLILVAALLMAISEIEQVISKYKIKTSYSYQKDILKEINRLYKEKKISEALIELDKIKQEKYHLVDSRKIEQTLIDAMITQARTNLHDGNYAAAANSYKKLAKQLQHPDPGIYYLIGLCMEKMGKPDSALYFYRTTLAQAPAYIPALKNMAEIYGGQYKNFGEAVNFYNKASDAIINEYTEMYGKAYLILVNPKITPQTHFEVYYGKALIFYETREYEKAIGACNWAIYLKPDNPAPYFIAGKAALMLNNTTAACKYFTKAEKNGMAYAREFSIKYCE